ncbi:hypothetical protein V8F20_001108 [Naviculisporaceae sp. PSN 640]
MGPWQQKDNTPEGTYDPPQPDAHLPFGCMPNSDSAMNSSNPFLPSPADTVVDMHRDISFHHDGDFGAPLPGQQPLLSAQDQQFVQNFFSLISENNTNFGEAGLPFTDNWTDNLPPAPPTVLGHQTHTPDVPVDSILSSLVFDPFTPSFAPAPPIISPDVLGAAQALSRPNVPAHQFHGLPVQMPATMGPPVGSIPSPQYLQFANEQRHDSLINRPMMADGYTNMYNSVVPAAQNNTRRTVPHPEISFGTDRNFTGGNFNSSETNIEGRIFQHQNSILDCLQPNTSAAPTRASSPQPNGALAVETKSPIQLRTAQEFVIPVRSESDSKIEPPKKRRKSKPKTNPDADETAAFSPDAPNITPGRMASGSIGSIPESAVANESSPVDEPPPGAGAKRRRGGAGAPKKPPRQNLSEEQKRANHIKSEQKRRTDIKNAFQDVQEIVPEIRGQGLSKSVILSNTVEYMERLLGGNDELENLLRMAG